MSAAQVDALSDVYGEVTGRAGNRISDDLLRETIEMFGDAMSDDDKQVLLAAYAEHGPSADGVTETRGDPGLVLGYETDRLVEIMPAIGQRPLYLDGTELFSLSGVEALAVLERVNGGKGRYADTEAAFDALAISAVGFCVTDQMGGVRALDDADERFRERTVSLRERGPAVP